MTVAPIAPDSPHRVSSPFGMRTLRGRAARMHNGVDIWAPIGTPVRAVESGRVLAATANGAPHFSGYGHTVLLAHDSGAFSLYAHLSALSVEPDQRVSEGQTIALSGDTNGRDGNATRFDNAPHLHFEIRTRVRGRTPGAYGEGNVDPIPWLAERGVTVVRGKFQADPPSRFPIASLPPSLEALRRRVEAFGAPSPVPAPRTPSRPLSGAGIGIVAALLGAGAFVIIRGRQ